MSCMMLYTLRIVSIWPFRQLKDEPHAAVHIPFLCSSHAIVVMFSRNTHHVLPFSIASLEPIRSHMHHPLWVTLDYWHE